MKNPEHVDEGNRDHSDGAVYTMLSMDSPTYPFLYQGERTTWLRLKAEGLVSVSERVLE